MAEITFGMTSTTDDDEGEKTEHVVPDQPTEEDIPKKKTNNKIINLAAFNKYMM